MKKIVFSLMVPAVLAFTAPAMAAAKTYEVTIQNVTSGISFTPFLLATHNKRVSLFELGAPASESLGRVAEGGDTAGLQAELDASNGVFQTVSSESLLGPGESVTVSIDARGGKNKLSLVSMLLPTNDNIVAAQAIDLPSGMRARTTYLAMAYDAGTETNSEECAFIPGPTCSGEAFSDTDLGEGYIFPSAGIHGEADLSKAMYDWQGPVAIVTIMRVY